jgi:hypothetical protein
MSGNPSLMEKGLEDKAYCFNLASHGDAVDFNTFSTCMDRNGYYRRDLASSGTSTGGSYDLGAHLRATGGILQESSSPPAMISSPPATISAPDVSSNAQCPVGAYSLTDSFGNQVCKRSNDGSVATTQGSPQNCPVGSYPSVDQWGTRVCQSFNNGTMARTYDTSHGCPVGTFAWTDSWGNPTCKSF